MGTKKFLTVFVFCALFALSYGCQMDGVSSWIILQHVTILDTHEGTFFERQTTNILAITNVVFGSNLNNGPYMNVHLTNSTFVIETNEDFILYEEYETTNEMTVFVTFSCSGGSSSSLSFRVEVEDTNNNDPIFRPDDVFEFTVIPPLPPGFEITNVLPLTVRDIDLTTQEIIFEIFDSTYFEIAYDEESSTTPKEFKASLTTTTFIRNIPEPIEFTISATDVDLTDDPPRTRTATIRIQSVGVFELPEELVFTQTFYMADYIASEEIVLREPISLQQGYHEDVKFSLGAGDHSEYFNITSNVNNVELVVIRTLPLEILAQRKVFLVVRADREHTSGTSATVIVQLPEEVNLQFEQPIYEGNVIDNVLHLSNLVLSQGYENRNVSAEIQSDYSSYFNYETEENRITISMDPLSSNVIEQNTFLNLKIIASTSLTTASTVVILEIIKDDTITPVFQRPLYTGTYNVSEGLTIEQIILLQGYDDTVQIALSGDHWELFQLERDGPNTTLGASSLPTELFKEQQILLTIEATKPRTVGATATISIALPPEILLEFELLNYKGEIIDNILELEELVLSQGYENEVIFVDIQHEHSSFFNYVVNQNRIIELSMLPLDSNIIEQNTFINLLVTASTSRSTASTTVILDIIKNDTTTPAFGRTVYSGSYDPVLGLDIEQIIIIQGYDDTVEVSLEGDHTDYFQLNPNGPTIELIVSSLPSDLYPLGSLLMTIEASKPRTVGANAAIFISLPTARELGFSQETYRGAILLGDYLTLETIVLSIGYDDDVLYNITGDYASHFQTVREQNQISIELKEQLPETATLENDFLLLTLLAYAPHAISTTTTIILEIIKDDTFTPVFNEKIYSVTYTSPTNLDVPSIFLTQGFDDTVSFRVAGDHSTYFAINPSESNIALSVRNPIPEELIFNEKVLVFNIIADKPLTVGARAAISVSFPTELTEPTPLAFSKTYYTGSLKNDVLTLETIVLDVGFTNNTQFTISSDYEDYFQVSNQYNIVTISLTNATLLENLNSTFIAIELEARRERAVPVRATVIIDIERPESVIAPVFSNIFYRAVYKNESYFQFEEEISLSDGFDDTVTFELEGDYNEWFEVTNNDDMVIITTNGVPEHVLETNNHIIFAVVARKTGANDGRATIIVDLPSAKTPETLILRFTQPSYQGTIEDNILRLPYVTLAGIYDMAITLTPTGEYASYFTFTRESNVINIELSADFPSDISNSFIIIDVEASYENAISSSTTLIIELVKEPQTQIITPVFEQAYYVGQYSEQDALVFENSIQLIQGFDETVSITLAGEDANYFEPVLISQNNFTLSATDQILQINDRRHLLFSIVASKPGTINGEAAIIITLPDVSEGQVLGFEHINYVGSLDGNTVNLSQIVLNEGFTQDVQFSLLGDLASFFEPQQDLATVTLTLREPIPENLLPSNRLIVLHLQATAPQVLPAYTTIILDVIVDSADPPGTINLEFTETYYIGNFSTTGGLAFPGLISLVEGYDESVEFDLEGDHAQWFRLDRTENGATLALQNPIPSSVLANNQQLVFVVRADRPGSTTARATIVILFTDDVSDGQVLGFEHINYVGSLDGNTVNLSQIVLNEGFTQDVQFSLLGDLASFFEPQQDLATVTLTLREPIPENLLPSNRLIVLHLQATAPQVLPAYTTIILDVIVDSTDTPGTIILEFAETYYIGNFSTTGGLAFPGLISLVEGYDESVEFDLEGDHAQWFRLDRTENGATLALQNPIPSSVLANNQQLVFVVRADRPGSTTARATIVILFTDDVSDGQVLGFEHINYVGSLDGNTVNLSQIVLNEGFTQDVQFSLLGDLASFFEPQQDLATVTLTLREPIPENLLPSNRLIVLHLQATAPQVLPAYTTIILDVIVDSTDTPGTIILEFAETYYIGNFSTTGGLAFPGLISLVEGYDESVEFDLEGDHAQWFRLDRTENGATLALQNPIPSSVLANNQQLVFVVRADRPGSTTARATIVILFTDDVSDGQVLGFEHINYVGSLDGNTVNLSQIVLNEGFTQDVQFSLLGDLASFFEPQQDLATVTLTLREPIPENLLPSNRLIVLHLQATAPQVLPAYTTIILDVTVDSTDTPGTIILEFAETYYIGNFSTTGGLAFPGLISLVEGYDESVEFDLEGDHAQWFRLERTENGATLALQNPIPSSVLANNQQLVFVVRANRPGSTTARATIVILFTDDVSDGQVLGFEHINYVGSLDGNTVNLSQIVLNEGFTQDVQFSLLGDLASFFEPQQDLATVTLTLREPIPENLLPSNRLIVLHLQATAPQVLPAYTTIILDVTVDSTDTPGTIILEFAETYYIGNFSTSGGLAFPGLISLVEGYDESVEFDLEGDHAQWFRLERTENGATLALQNPIPSSVLANNQQLVFVVRANRPGSTTARATIVILFTDDVSDGQVLGFEHINYVGSLDGNTVNLSQIVLNEGFTQDVQFSLLGDLASFFEPQQDLATVTLTLREPIPENLLPSNRLIVLHLQATAPQVLPAYTTIILDVTVDSTDTPGTIILEFAETYYIGNFSTTGGLAFPGLISLVEGYDESVEFDLEGDHAQWFRLDRTENGATLALQNPIPSSVLANNQQLVFVVRADRPGSTTARATIVILVTDGAQANEVSFSQVLYEGRIQNTNVQHEIITITGYERDQVDIVGTYASLFTARHSDGFVTVELVGPLTIPVDLRHVFLELRADNAAAILILEITDTEIPVVPSITFSSTSYVVQVEMSQTGFVGQIQATADNGEEVTYSLILDNEHLQSRLSVNSDGELHLSAPVNIGVYNFQAVATTVFTRVNGSTTVNLSVEDITGLAPLIVIDRDEEEPHRNLVLLDPLQHEGCQYSLINKWPADQNWLYVDESGLHADAIDREHPSIAFMALSQIQVELILNCNIETRTKRSSRATRQNWLGPYDYGVNTWLLGNTIEYNPRRTIVNFIVNDINDNSPIFIGKENEPIAVGYPVSDLVTTIAPRSLIELKATDADVGENAALFYWSSESQLAVSSSTGFVHVRDNTELTNDMNLVISATDRNGQGLTGTILLTVKLLDINNIAVLTVQNAFLEDEGLILSNLSSALGYEVKSLRSAVISNSNTNEQMATSDAVTSEKRAIARIMGASLQLHVYGLIEREPVAVERLSDDIYENTAVTAFTITSVISLEEHIEGVCNIFGQDIGLLVATIVLSCLLLLLIVAAVTMFIYLRRRALKYEQFSDANSFASKIESPFTEPNAEGDSSLPRLNLEELKRSERRLQDMLNAPMKEVTVKPANSANNPSVSPVTIDSKIPIIIQDKLKDIDESDDDEFGERKLGRRKSVVTFNENVEKIIHVEDNLEESTPAEVEYEIFKL